MTLGLYVPGKSLIHRLPTNIKILKMVISGICIFFVESIPMLLVLLGIMAVIVAIARIPYRLMYAQIKPMIWMLIFIAGAHAILADWETGIVLALRFLNLIILASVITLTTRTSEMVDAITVGLRPLRRYGVQPEQFSLMVAIAIRFIPVIIEQIKEIQDAQRARGIERPVIAFLVPLLVKTFHMADALTDAIDAKGFGTDTKPL